MTDLLIQQVIINGKKIELFGILIKPGQRFVIEPDGTGGIRISTEHTTASIVNNDVHNR